MSALLDLASWITLVAGSLLCIVGGIGLLRLPDFYSRTHAVGLTDTLGATLIVLGLMLQADLGVTTVKLAMLVVLLHVTSPTGTHALVKAAHSRGVRVQDADE